MVCIAKNSYLKSQSDIDIDERFYYIHQFSILGDCFKKDTQKKKRDWKRELSLVLNYIFRNNKNV